MQKSWLQQTQPPGKKFICLPLFTSLKPIWPAWDFSLYLES